MSTKPSADFLIEHAWRTSAPTWTRDLSFDPNSLWSRICRLALQWQADDLSEEEIEAHYAAALAEVEAEHDLFRKRVVANLPAARRGPLPKAERVSGAVAERTRDLMQELLNRGD